MAGESEQEKQAKKQQGTIDTEYGRMQGFNPTVQNRFNNLKLPFGYDDMRKNLDQVYNQDIGMVNRQAATDTARATRGTAGRMANAGVTKGSIFNEAVAGAGQPIASAKYNTLGDLSRNRNAQNIGLMGMENKNVMDILGNATQVDLANIMNELKKSGVLQNIMGLSQNNLQNYDETTWFDDALAIANTAAQFIPK